MTPDFTLLHADTGLLVLDKPAGLLAVPGRGEAGRDNLASRVLAVHAEACIVHRLDMATSGLMLLARGPAMQRVLGVAFARREVHKQYIAVVEGLIEGDAGCITAPLAADWQRRPRQKVDLERGKPSISKWRVLARDREAGTTRLELTPVSGRTHQLRVHLLSIGHPIRGDALYAPAPLNSPRLLLHASRLALRHPTDGTECVFESPAPF